MNDDKILIQVDESKGFIKCSNKNVLIRIVLNQKFLNCIKFVTDNDLLVKDLTLEKVVSTINEYFNPEVFYIERINK